ncbi:PEGA domain-containing protein [Telluribacter sp.]|jgi:hypothetical protein|uniref:PEGA domain-containing protein n=1 Tax=Telluribacter sp. TaxID=1978767 RepID=UPI002E13334D|nr:PEGA domain-containing protein [Telluribacter sp.]
MKKQLFLISLVLVTVFLNGCATIFSGSRQTVRIESYPPGANIEIDGISHGITPATVSMRKSLNATSVVLTKEGYQTKLFSPSQEFDLVGILNIFFWPGFIIDAVNGSMMRFDSPYYQIKLEPVSEAVSSSGTNK